MACRDAYEANVRSIVEAIREAASNSRSTYRLLFGVDSMIASNNLLQNNLTQFEWVTRNKLYPNFWGRNVNGDNCLTKEEITFLHKKACKIAPMYVSNEVKDTEEQGKSLAKQAVALVMKLDISVGTAVFLEIQDDEPITTAFLKGYAQTMIAEGFIPAFKANTDAAYAFDREYSRGMQGDPDVFGECLIWATSPTIEEFDNITTTHLIHPDQWGPFAPSGMVRNDIAVWCYGKRCHPIEDNKGEQTLFNINLVRNDQVIIRAMY